MPTSPLCCSACNKPATESRCGSCLIVQYCNVACQKAHWPAHKPACRAGRALPFVSMEEARKTMLRVKALHCSPDFQPRTGPLRDLDLYEQRLTLQSDPGFPNLLAIMSCTVLPLAQVGVMVCVAERNGEWLPFIKVGDPMVPGTMQMECLDLGVDPSLVTINAAKSAFYAGATRSVCPVYYNSRWQAYMHC